jgi:hypothetical protein
MLMAVKYGLRTTLMEEEEEEDLPLHLLCLPTIDK